MPYLVQNLIVLLIVATALVYLAHSIRVAFHGTQGKCGCGKGSCAKLAPAKMKATYRD